MNGALRRLSQPLAQRLTGYKGAMRTQQRTYAADAHGEAKVNFWEAPTQIPRWKEEHIVLAVLGTWGFVIYSSLKIFGKKEQPGDAVASPAQPAS